MRAHPHLYELAAPALVEKLSRRAGRRLRLAELPDETWRDLRASGFDLVWLMGVWRRSPAARRLALEIPELRASYDRVLPGWGESDVAGSPYAIFDYSPDPALGPDGTLAGVRDALHRRGLALIVDFVPNHVAMDHPWTVAHPDWFVRREGRDAHVDPAAWFRTAGGVTLAHGRDPNFPAWTDTAQLNHFSPGLRAALVETLLAIAGEADGVRCDMAMLALNSVFARTWETELSGTPPPAVEFWEEAITAVKRRHPHFLFMAEAYWGLEGELERLGFDFTYDKTGYDALRGGDAGALRGWLESPAGARRGAVRFIENHDEERAIPALGRDRSLAAAVIISTLPGMRFFHGGQREGWRLRVPVQLGREPEEKVDEGVAAFYRRLLAAADQPVFHRGSWNPREIGPASDGDTSPRALLAWEWQDARERRLVVVNFSAERATGRVRLADLPGGGEALVLEDQLTGERYARERSDLREPGLYVALDPWRAHIMAIAAR